ncbi:hypothetical protein AC249_AIPGENE11775 [Exaiptasia diaphana]|nr:hypothetical protein AC249_AIPGENE11775 [Exaiptasia diaphana]
MTFSHCITSVISCWRIRCVDRKTEDFDTIDEADEDESIHKENQRSVESNQRKTRNLNMVMDDQMHDMDEMTSNESPALRSPFIPTDTK